MSDKPRNKNAAAEEVLSLWFVKAGAKVPEVKLRSDRTVKEAVASTANALKKRYEHKSSSEVRARRIGR